MHQGVADYIYFYIYIYISISSAAGIGPPRLMTLAATQNSWHPTPLAPPAGACVLTKVLLWWRKNITFAWDTVPLSWLPPSWWVAHLRGQLVLLKCLVFLYCCETTCRPPLLFLFVCDTKEPHSLVWLLVCDSYRPDWAIFCQRQLFLNHGHATAGSLCQHLGRK